MRKMNLDAIKMSSEDAHLESLTAALQAIAGAYIVKLDYADLCAAMGVSFAAVAVGGKSPGSWMSYGRDAFLEPAARLFGFELRDLHPPDVAVDMLAAEEFEQHWELSYKPLIRRALEHDQPVLAWQGWPDPFALEWGVVTAIAGDDFVGTTPRSAGQLQRLTRPALQCYVVERFEPVVPSGALLFAIAVRHADGYMNRAPFGGRFSRLRLRDITDGRREAASDSDRAGTFATQIVTGPAALAEWAQWLQSADNSDWSEHRDHARRVAAARSSAAAFLRRMQGIVDRNYEDSIRTTIARCESMVSCLAPSCDDEVAQSRFCSTDGRKRFIENVLAAETDDRQIAALIEKLASTSYNGTR